MLSALYVTESRERQRLKEVGGLAQETQRVGDRAGSQAQAALLQATLGVYPSRPAERADTAHGSPGHR